MSVILSKYFGGGSLALAEVIAGVVTYNLFIYDRAVIVHLNRVIYIAISVFLFPYKVICSSVWFY